MIEELFQRLASIFRVKRGVDEFAQVLDAREGLGRVLGFKELDVAGAVDQKLQDLPRYWPSRRERGRRWSLLAGLTASAPSSPAGCVRSVACSRLIAMSATEIEMQVDRNRSGRSSSSQVSGRSSASTRRGRPSLHRFGDLPLTAAPRMLPPPSLAHLQSDRESFSAPGRPARAAVDAQLPAQPLPTSESPVSSARLSSVSIVVLPIPRTGVLITRSSDTESSGFRMTFKYEIMSLISARS